ncbi:hypothetical protein NBRC10512_000445 [Rhodotorula toruloides]|uniref:RHTO0S04e10550g1_1 n=2 Tax=Rhodotorula toruloides TaxID=5286 RepID=A0A061AWR1_RHOTO|nr:uncharacterized protein RHTO_05158 [Rhodotorula toruloides NP11]EMS19211.1 hypothetical protein RHTO_05158 [Rhodotorula toruloides NP11]CDR39839.1 RHTO0S04e10550g1_1 [Rhodotorula toruloides]
MPRELTPVTAARYIRYPALAVWRDITGRELSKQWIFQGTHLPDDISGLYQWLLSIRGSTNRQDAAALENQSAVRALARELEKAGAEVRAMRRRGASEQEMAHYILSRYSIPQLGRRTGFPLAMIRANEQAVEEYVDPPAQQESQAEKGRHSPAHLAPPPPPPSEPQQHASHLALAPPQVFQHQPPPPQLRAPVHHSLHSTPPPVYGAPPSSNLLPSISHFDGARHPPQHHAHAPQSALPNSGPFNLPPILPRDELQLPPMRLPPGMAEEEEELRRARSGQHSLSKQEEERLGYGAAWTARKAAIYGRRATGW